MSAQTHQASLKIKFLIIGGGISGLASAYTLSASEKLPDAPSSTILKTEGSIRSPPNMTRILTRWPGMDAFLDTHATRCTGVLGDTGAPVGAMKFHHEIMDELEAEFLVVQHEDLRRQLYLLCLDTGVVFIHGKAENIAKEEDGISVTLKDGRKLCGDLIVGADGHNSFARSFVMSEGAEVEHVVSAANISIPTEVFEKDDEFRSLCRPNQFTIWMGTGSSLTGTFDSQCKTFNLSICSPTPLESADSDMYDNHDLSALQPFDLSGYDPRLQRLIKSGGSCRPIVHKVFKQVDVVGFDGSLVLVGDAAHSILINGSHNSSMAIEDAATLGTLFSHLSGRKQIPVFTETYEELRQSRTDETRISEYRSLVQISLPHGELQKLRDDSLLLTLDEAFDNFENCESSDLLVQAWEQYLVVFSHDASEAVDNWWSKWSFTIE
ncbi:FAD-binding-3 domain-containing protein [Favolaschia claudopus]|uniref:FAD-binding-3 domain-containing protein n=1 Tax=Favolaschia claudopus TaxID=2862362 RepID=A0AAW0AH95_9AGAR